jgi:hypothetical protein
MLPLVLNESYQHAFCVCLVLPVFLFVTGISLTQPSCVVGDTGFLFGVALSVTQCVLLHCNTCASD